MEISRPFLVRARVRRFQRESALEAILERSRGVLHGAGQRTLEPNDGTQLSVLVTPAPYRESLGKHDREEYYLIKY